MDRPPFEFNYVNHRGQYEHRSVIPLFVWYGSTEYHTDKQWFMHAYDMGRKAERDFAMDDMIIRAD
jgi:predicted DNA-binding transcriptional regulator YafY